MGGLFCLFMGVQNSGKPAYIILAHSQLPYYYLTQLAFPPTSFVSNFTWQHEAEATVSVDQGLRGEGQDIGELFYYTI